MWFGVFVFGLEMASLDPNLDGKGEGVVAASLRDGWLAAIDQDSLHSGHNRITSNSYSTSHFQLHMIPIIIISVEHCLFLASKIYNQYQEIIECNWVLKEGPLTHFFKRQFTFIFQQLNFNLAYAIFVEIINLIFTLAWNYMDLFVMLVSIGLTTRFRQINKRMEKLKGKVNHT